MYNFVYGQDDDVISNADTTQSAYNMDVIIDENPGVDGYLADNEESDDDAPLAQVSTCRFIYIWQGNSQSIRKERDEAS